MVRAAERALLPGAGVDPAARSASLDLGSGRVAPRAAAPADGGFLIAAVYDSRSTCESFVEKLMSVMPVEGGLVGPPQEHGAEIVNSVGLSG